MQLLFGDRTGMALAAALLASLVLVTPRIAESDAIEYFSYLPSVLLDGDLDFEDEYTQFYEEDPEGRQGFKETFLDRPTDTGLRLNFGPIGSEGAEPLNFGFDVNIAGASFGAPGSYYGTDDYGHKGKRKNRAVPGLGKYHGTDTHLTEACTIEMKAAVSKAVKDGKFFCQYRSTI